MFNIYRYIKNKQFVKLANKVNGFLINFLYFISFLCTFAVCIMYNIALDGDSRYLSAEEQSRELTRSILREVGKLSEQWNNLIDRSDHWKHRLDEYMTVSDLNVYSFYYIPI